MALDARTQTAVRAAWEALRPEITEKFETLFACPELSCLEFRSAEVLADWLRAHGFDVEAGTAGIPTAFTARFTSGSGPRIAILAEYDALPGLDNLAMPKRASTGRLPGHGCGHNHIGPANAAAAIAVAKVMAAGVLGGEIVVIGCPAEEIIWGKLALQARGAFNGFDIVLTSHGDYQNGALSRPCYAAANGEFRFTGEASHSGKMSARNALSCTQTALAKVGSVLESEYEGLQFNYLFRFSGFAPGVIPDEVRIWCAVKHEDFDTMRAGYGRMESVFQDTAESFGVSLRSDLIAACRGYLPNDVVAGVLSEALAQVGPPAWSAGDLAYMEALSAACSPGEPFTLHRTLDYFDSGIDYYAQDDGDISWQVPLGRVNWAYPDTVPIHHWAWTALSGHPASYPGPLMASEALALAAVELLVRPDLVATARDELDQRTRQMHVPAPEFGLFDVLTGQPEAFWDASWT